MKEKYIEHIKPNQTMHTLFENEPYITREQIRTYARAYAKKISDVLPGAQTKAEEYTIIVELLDGDIFADYLRQNPHQMSEVLNALESSTIDVIDPYIEAIREVVLEELQAILPMKVTAVKKKMRYMRLAELYHSEVVRYHQDYPDGWKQEGEAYVHALKSLYALPERSPNLLYSLIEQKKSSNKGAWIEIHRFVQIKSFDQALNEYPLPPLDTLLRYLCEAMNGAQFLVDHGLRLSDLRAKNIIIDQSDDTGKLFDYDGLRIADTKTSYFCAPKFRPPERTEFSPITEANMIYEFGCVLSKTCRQYTYEQKFANPIAKLLVLSKRMESPNPEKRPTIAASIAEIKQRIKI